MATHTNISQETASISNLVAGIGNQLPYTAPEGYFESFAENMLQQVRCENATAADEIALLSPLLSSLQQQSTFTAPINYFEELPGNAAEGAKAIDFVNRELENLSPVMLTLKQQQAYAVPENYFEQFPAQVLQQVNTETGINTNIVSISFAQKMIRIAAAAAIAGIIAVSGWWYTRYYHGTASPEMAKVEAEVKQLQDKEIEQYINGQEGSYQPSVALLSNTELMQDDIKDMIADISDEELQQYLENHQSEKESFN